MEQLLLLVFIIIGLLSSGVILALMNRQKIKLLSQEVARLRSELARLTPESPGLSPETKPQTIAEQYELAQPENTAPYFQLSLPMKSVSQHLSSHSLLWFGGFVLALGGIFLARYAIEAGLISPQARVIAGFLVGVALFAVAELLYRNPERFNIQSTHISAALASAGTITCFSMLVVASRYYHLLSPTPAFSLMALVSLIATFAALRFGPIVATIGIIGSYSVPLFFSDQSFNALEILSYMAFISVSALYVARQVARQWLWWLSVVGHFSWFLLAVILSAIDDIGILLCFSVASLYLYPLSGVLGWRLITGEQSPLSALTLLKQDKDLLTLLLSVLPLWGFFVLNGFNPSLLLCTLVIVSLLLLAPLKHASFDSWPILGLLLIIATLLLQVPATEYADERFIYGGLHLYSQLASLALFIYALLMQFYRPRRPAFSLLFVVTTPSLFGLTYVFSPEQAQFGMYAMWATQLTLYAFVALQITRRHNSPRVRMAGWLLAHGLVALILTLLLEAGSLSLALSAQLVLLGLARQRYQYAAPDWVVKIALTILLLRLTLAPWVVPYATETLWGIHWSLIIYPLCLAFIYYATRLFSDPELKTWLSGSQLHIIALFITTETSYQLVGHYPDFLRLTFEECVLLGMNWLIIAIVYLYRSTLTPKPNKLYLFAAGILFAGSGLMHTELLTALNPFFSRQSLGPWWGINWLLPLWLIPALLLTLMISHRLICGKPKILALALSCLFMVLFINASIRYGFHDSYITLSLGIEQTELYTYSLVWLMIAVAAITYAHLNNQPLVHKMGFTLISLVVLKAFLIDMSQLAGLYRALSFLGLGLSLVAIGWLFQRLRQSSDKTLV